jgi:hypothetical protein
VTTLRTRALFTTLALVTLGSVTFLVADFEQRKVGRDRTAVQAFPDKYSIEESFEYLMSKESLFQSVQSSLRAYSDWNLPYVVSGIDALYESLEQWRKGDSSTELVSLILDRREELFDTMLYAMKAPSSASFLGPEYGEAVLALRQSQQIAPRVGGLRSMALLIGGPLVSQSGHAHKLLSGEEAPI